MLAITDNAGDVLERRYYDAFGDIKSYIGQAANTQYAHGLSIGSVTSMAFTGHRTLIAAGVIHMGGRVYDATIGRFLSADPHIQSPLNSQSLNRYSYTLNNPLSWTDTSGYFFDSIFKALKSLFKMIGKIIKAVLKVVQKVVKVIAKVIKKIGQFVKKYWRVIVAVAVVWFAPQITAAIGLPTAGLSGAIAVGAVAGGLSALVITGSLKGMAEGALFGAIAGGIAHAIGGALPSGEQTSSFSSAAHRSGGSLFKRGVQYFNDGTFIFTKSLSTLGKVVKSAIHGLAQGAVNKLRGGSFSKGFISTLFSNGSQEFGFATSPFRVGVIGGISAELAGGEFSRGFFRSWAVSALNHDLHKPKESSFMENSGAYLPSFSGGVVDFFAGFGDTASFGLTNYIRDRWGIDGGINYGSSSYNAGLYSGVVGSIGTIAAGGMIFNIGLRSLGGANQLYHFTSAANAANISNSGILYGSSGLYGHGVYATAFRSAHYARLQGAASTEAMITITLERLLPLFLVHLGFPIQSNFGSDFMKFIIFILIYLLFITLHGFYFLSESENYLTALRQKQYLWIIYFLASHVLAEKILKRLNN